ncbi:hypothetical protein DUNSADRAFT_17311 [Dunaliella salina]|uniref:Secreted protein n=1 Tax=Dunaliella salina TaxID=3046 RepID=A0ABQ7G1Y6_DUNSA|nr:hypothetical protein DUNSADRAFT_17311 [Dunaliella salina]KAF5828622.1 hypothetical protein DUNSADRAFT_17311 [Dunaliella salina]|eukprot:KAF5828621.1 hypothetical protein DUNSADRAFT_17311 [Dunaliella salina]
MRPRHDTSMAAPLLMPQLAGPVVFVFFSVHSMHCCCLRTCSMSACCWQVVMPPFKRYESTCMYAFTLVEHREIWEAPYEVTCLFLKRYRSTRVLFEYREKWEVSCKVGKGMVKD